MNGMQETCFKMLSKTQNKGTDIDWITNKHDCENSEQIKLFLIILAVDYVITSLYRFYFLCTITAIQLYTCNTAIIEKINL